MPVKPLIIPEPAFAYNPFTSLASQTDSGVFT